MSNTLNKTAPFDCWLKALKDEKAKGAIAARITRIENGLLGDYKELGEGLMEFRLDVGPGYRLYATRQGKTIFLLLCGGDKSTQKADIAAARAMIAVIAAHRKAARKAAGSKAARKKKK